MIVNLHVNKALELWFEKEHAELFKGRGKEKEEIGGQGKIYFKTKERY